MDHLRLQLAFKFVAISRFGDGGQLMTAANLCLEAVAYPTAMYTRSLLVNPNVNRFFLSLFLTLCQNVTMTKLFCCFTSNPF